MIINVERLEELSASAKLILESNDLSIYGKSEMQNIINHAESLKQLATKVSKWCDNFTSDGEEALRVFGGVKCNGRTE